MSLVSSIVGGGLSLVGGLLAGRGQEEAARIAAESSRFAPYDVTTPFGTGTFNTEEGTAEATLSPEYLALQQSLFGRGENILGSGPSPFEVQAGEQGLGYLGALGSYDPAQAAREQYERLSAISAPEEERARDAFESNLFKRGLFGSTSGSLQQEAFTKAAMMRDLAREDQAFTGAQGVQDSLLRRALSLEGARSAGASDRFSLGSGYLGNALNIGQLATQPLELGASFGGRQAAAGASAAQFPWQAAQNRSDMQSAFWSSLGQGVMQSGLFTGRGNSGTTTPTGGSYNPVSLFGTSGLGY